MNLENLGLDEEALKGLAGLTVEFIYDKGVQVEHEKKELLKKLTPEEYIIKGVITGKLAKRNGKLVIDNEKLFTAQEYQEKNKSHYYFLRNLRDLRDLGKGNPYESFVAVSRIQEDEEKYKLEEDERVILMISKREDVFHRVNFEATKILIAPYVGKDDILLGSEIEAGDIEEMLEKTENEEEIGL